jgi:zinc/manganese transport system substrate-binding protein
MKRTALLSLLAGIIATGGLARAARAEVDVIATVPTLAALTAAVGGAHVRVRSLSLPTQDPHFVDAKPSLLLELNKARLLVAVGLDLEVGWLPTLLTGARNAEIQRGTSGYLECASHVRILEVPRVKVDRSMGDIHPGGNPHFLYDPRGASGCATAIAERLSAIDPSHAADYKRNLSAFEKQLRSKAVAWQKQLAPHRGKGVVTYHKSWIYLLDWAGLREVGTLEPKPGIPPSPRHVARVLEVARKAGARAVLQEAFYPDRMAKLVAQKIGGRLVSPPGGPDVVRGQTYFQYMDRMVADLAAALGTS